MKCIYYVQKIKITYTNIKFNISNLGKYDKINS